MQPCSTTLRNAVNNLSNRTFFEELVVERPVAQHLEERVVVDVLTDVVKVIVLAAGPDALLAVRRGLELSEGGGLIRRTEEDGLVSWGGR